jgi:hypothetical protein
LIPIQDEPEGRSCWVVNIRMDDAEKLSLESIGRFVTASEDIRFEAEDRQQLYGWVEQVLVGRQYAQLGKAARGLVRRYIEKMTGLSRAQVTRLIARYTASGRVQVTVYRRRRFTQLYTRGRHRVAGLGRRSARDAERPGDTAHSGARGSALQAAGVRAAGYDLGRSSVQPAQAASATASGF